MFIITSILFGILSILIVVYLWHIRKAYDFFNRLNIPGPSPTFFFGNLSDFLRTKRMSISIKQWTQKYGRIFGYFEGHTPILVISDPDILQDIFIKSFSNFHSRRALPLEDQHAKDVHIFTAPGLRWKRQRFVINPTFSSAKLKEMTPLIHHSIDIFMNKMADECKKNQPFDIYGYFKRFTMDTIWSCGFGLDTDMQNNINNPYLIHSQKVFDSTHNFTILIMFAILMTELNYIWIKLSRLEKFCRYWIRQIFPFLTKLIDDNPGAWIRRQAYTIIDQREKMARTNRVDLMQLMLESATNEDFIQDHPSSSTTVDSNDNESQLIRKLTVPEISSNIFVFMVAGYETTSTALAYVSYVLATHPNEQHKLQEHIDTYFNPETEHSMPSYDTITQMDYLDMFVREVLRMYPIVPSIINRQNNEDFYIKDVGVIPVDTIITTDIYSLHFDIDLWGPVDPYIFHPERFSTKRHPMAWIPFGVGPRNCVGMRFALTELKMIIVRLLKTYSIIGCSEETRKPYENLKEILVIAPEQTMIRLERRQEHSE